MATDIQAGLSRLDMSHGSKLRPSRLIPTRNQRVRSWPSAFEAVEHGLATEVTTAYVPSHGQRSPTRDLGRTPRAPKPKFKLPWMSPGLSERVWKCLVILYGYYPALFTLWRHVILIVKAWLVQRSVDFPFVIDLLAFLSVLLLTMRLYAPDFFRGQPILHLLVAWAACGV
jgi:hypothetical protein